jgi:poly(3-hydroxybutyrate) depolymerase
MSASAQMALARSSATNAAPARSVSAGASVVVTLVVATGNVLASTAIVVEAAGEPVDRSSPHPLAMSREAPAIATNPRNPMRVGRWSARLGSRSIRSLTRGISVFQ